MLGVNHEPNMLSDINKMGNNSINNIQTVSSQVTTPQQPHTGGRLAASWFYSANIPAECDQFSADCAQLEVRAQTVPDRGELLMNISWERMP